MLTTIRKPSWPPGRLRQQVLDPDVAVDAVEGEAEDARADQDEHHEGRELRGRVHRLAQQLAARGAARASAMISAPVAPMAPPSVGVATPRKIVPSTRKISASGGISTNVTCSASRDSRPSLSTLVDDARRRTRTPAPTQRRRPGARRASRRGRPARSRSGRTPRRPPTATHERRTTATACRSSRRARAACAPPAAAPAPSAA